MGLIDLLTMRLLFIAFFLAPACTGFLARVRDHFEKKLDHFEKKFKKPECHVDWEDVTTPHCETTHEQVCTEEYKNQCKTEYSTTCKTEYNTQCKTEYEELCETVDKQKCHTEHDQRCHEEYSEECQTEYSEQCTEEPREACHTESTQECATEYSEVCGTEFEEACHTEYTEQCKDVPECWEEQQEECHTVQVKVHHEQPEHKKWKRSSGEEGMYGESDVETTGGKKKRSTIALAAAGALGASAIAGAVTGAHFGQKLGFAGGLGVSKAIYLKRNKRSADGEEFALSEGMETALSEGMETINGVETIESGDLAALRKGRSIGLASAVGLKLGLAKTLGAGHGLAKTLGAG